MQYNGINKVASIGEQVVIHFLNIQVTMATVRAVSNTQVKFMVQKRTVLPNQIESNQTKSNLRILYLPTQHVGVIKTPKSRCVLKKNGNKAKKNIILIKYIYMCTKFYSILF